MPTSIASTQIEIQKNMKFIGRRLALLLAASPFSLEEKQAWAELIPEMLPDQLDRLIKILESSLSLKKEISQTQVDQSISLVSLLQEDILDQQTKLDIIHILCQISKYELKKEFTNLLMQWYEADKMAQVELKEDLETWKKTENIYYKQEHNAIQYQLRSLEKQWKQQKKIQELKEKLGFL
ncbi:hypothetical protein CO172_00575 [Candidatus Uhrbacteria bacterium CG_4_9_14_3_um_filter_36_7]|uniref:Uncharacterized protein n=1 Tax=Candidatus Uhrbacteria bacterium CG_4_9_14_3_um_filter_36_7 TaxID=1975033 RepID=A0A2M7XIQ4_9BACT|nr:MAG: hypothetical protein CO172_00575 [Candidatus Uhrbacteria bacterium CG_4_9_14_3_um_filter_36_7]